jgi:hypothetical protein
VKTKRLFYAVRSGQLKGQSAGATAILGLKYINDVPIDS